MTTPTTLRLLTLPAIALALTALTSPARAQESTTAVDQAMLREAQGEYQLADGRTLSVQVGVRRISVGVDAPPLQGWRAESSDLIVSPDGMRRVRLFRNADGTVDRIAFETDRYTR